MRYSVLTQHARQHQDRQMNCIAARIREVVMNLSVQKTWWPRSDLNFAQVQLVRQSIVVTPGRLVRPMSAVKAMPQWSTRLPNKMKMGTLWRAQDRPLCAKVQHAAMLMMQQHAAIPELHASQTFVMTPCTSVQHKLICAWASSVQRETLQHVAG